MPARVKLANRIDLPLILSAWSGGVNDSYADIERLMRMAL